MSIHPLVIAHRGASGYRPEHTRAAYELAISQGADAVEPDLVASLDGVLVIRHENEISGTTDVASRPEFANRRRLQVIDGQQLIGWFTEDFTWAELSTLRAVERLGDLRAGNTAFVDCPILRFRDLLQILDGAPRRRDGSRVGLVAEIKHASYFASIGLPLDELFIAELEENGWAVDDRLTVESFELTVLQHIRERGIRAKLVFLLEAEGAPADEIALRGIDARSFSSFLTAESLVLLAERIDGISVDKNQLIDDEGNFDGSIVTLAHDAGLTIFCWTLRAENMFLSPASRFPASGDGFGDWKSEFTGLMRLGLDGVFADQPDLAISARTALSDGPRSGDVGGPSYN